MAEGGRPSTRAALVVATGAYSDEGLRRLRSPVADAAALADVLADPEVGRFDVRTLLDRNSWELAEEIEAFFADRKRQDLLLLYITCHGVKDESGRLYFAAYNTKLNRLAATGLSSTFVNEQMDRTRSRRVVLLLDCCYSGAFAKLLAKGTESIDVTEVLQGSGRVIVTASSAMEYAFEGESVAVDRSSSSVFTSALVNGLRTGDADLDSDGRITMDELYDYVYERVRDITPNQTPGKIEHLQGDLLIARSRRGARVVQEPAPAPTPPPAPPPPLEAEPAALAPAEPARAAPGPAAPAPAAPAAAQPVLPPVAPVEPVRPGPGRRFPLGRVLALVAVLVAAVVASVLRRGVTPGAWQRLPDLGVALESPGVAVLDDSLWVVGGLSAAKGRPSLDTVRVYDPVKNAWRDGPRLPVPLDHAAVASDESRIWVVGGRTRAGKETISSETYRLDGPADTTWTRVSSARLPEARAAGALAWDGRRLVFAGGYSLPGGAPHAEVWALEGGKWRGIGKLRQAREHLAVATDNAGRVWFIGGYDGRNPQQLYDTVDIVDANGVHAGRSTVPMRASAAVWIQGAGVCLFGGAATHGLVDDASCLQPDGGVREWPALPTARAGVGAAVLRDRVYVVGGFAEGAAGTSRVDALPLHVS